jgi:molybdate transport system regulatory protein
MKTKDKELKPWIEGDLRLAGTLDTRMIELLKAIERTGSINQAAKRMGLSYKGAWQMLERANNSAPQTLLATAIGGNKGGGSVLTPAGRALLALFSRLEQQHQEFIAELNRSLREDSDTMLLLQRLVVRTSTRNQLFGRVTAIDPAAEDAQITVCLKGGEKVVASFSAASLHDLGLGIGADAVLMINSADIMLFIDHGADRISARNRLFGKVMRIQHDIVDSEVIVLLPSGDILAAMITQQSLKTLALTPGMPVWAAFNAHAPILGVKPRNGG